MDLHDNLMTRRQSILNINIIKCIDDPKFKINLELYSNEIDKLPLSILLKLEQLSQYRLGWYEYRTSRYFRDSYYYPTCEHWGNERIIYDFNRFIGAIIKTNIIKKELLNLTEKQQLEDLVGLNLPYISNKGASFILKNIKNYQKVYHRWDSIVTMTLPGYLNEFDEMVKTIYHTCLFKEELMILMWSPHKLGLEYFQE